MDAEPGLASLARLTMADVTAIAIRGKLGDTARQWPRTAAVAHILGWRLDDYQVTEVRDEDLTLPAPAQRTGVLPHTARSRPSPVAA